MRVVISVGGRFHAFNLAQQLARKDYLKKIITSYPKFETAKYGIPKEKIDSVIIKEILQRGWFSRFNPFQSLWNPTFPITELFDRAASKRVVPADIFVGWANQSLFSLKKAKSFGALGVIERGSSHILFQDRMIREEYEISRLRPAPSRLSDPRMIRRELAEYGEADYISIPSSFVKKTFIENGFPESKMIHVSYGVDLSSFRQVQKTDDVFRLIFAGGITIRKGVHYLLKTFSELNLPNSELLMIGSVSDEMKPFLRKYEGRYRSLGHVPQPELYKHYSQGSVFVLPSIEEGLALVTPQAMACGLPIIATTNTGAEDIVRDGKDGFIIPIRDVEALKQKILYLYENPDERTRMAHSAKERVASGFTWEDYGERITQEYERILKDKR